MRASLHQFPVTARLQFTNSVDVLRLQIACTETVADAYRLYEALKPLAQEMAQLVDLAAQRCDALQEER